MKIEDIIERLHEIAAELPLTDAVTLRDAANKLKQEWLDDPTEWEEEKEPTRAEKLAEAHWKYVKDALEPIKFGFLRLGTDETLSLIGFHYTSAFIHGYKHGTEDQGDPYP